MFRHSVRDGKAAGTVIAADAGGKETQRDTLQCVHCGMHWVVVPGSGRVRGFCMKCMGPTCGKLECLQSCYPMAKRNDDIERHGRLIIP